MRLQIAALATAVCAAMTIALPTVAQAASRPASAEAVSVKAPAGARIISVIHLPKASSASGCQHSFDGDTGWFICDTNLVTIHFVDGTIEDFGIGTDHATYTAWGTASGVLDHSWESMGGQAGNTNCAWDDRSSNAVIQVVQGSNLWCRYRTGSSGSWGAWFECNSWAPNSNSYSQTGFCG